MGDSTLMLQVYAGASMLDDRLVREAGSELVKFVGAETFKALKDWAAEPDPRRKIYSSYEILSEVSSKRFRTDIFKDLFSTYVGFERLRLIPAGSYIEELNHFYREHLNHTLRVFLLTFAFKETRESLNDSALFHDFGLPFADMVTVLDDYFLGPIRQSSEVGRIMDIRPLSLNFLTCNQVETLLVLNKLHSHYAKKDGKIYASFTNLLGTYCAELFEFLPTLALSGIRSLPHDMLSSLLFVTIVLPKILPDRLIRDALDRLLPSEYEALLVDELVERLTGVLTSALVVAYHDKGAGHVSTTTSTEVTNLIQKLVLCDEAQEWGRLAIGDNLPLFGRVDFDLDEGSLKFTPTEKELPPSRLVHILDSIVGKGCNLHRTGLRATIAVEFASSVSSNELLSAISNCVARLGTDQWDLAKVRVLGEIRGHFQQGRLEALETGSVVQVKEIVLEVSPMGIQAVCKEMK